MEYWNPHRHMNCTLHGFEGPRVEVQVPENEVAASGIVRVFQRMWNVIRRQEDSSAR